MKNDSQEFYQGTLKKGGTEWIASHSKFKGLKTYTGTKF